MTLLHGIFMGEKYPRWTYVVIFALLVIVVVLSVRALRGKKSQTAAVPPSDTAAQNAAPSDQKTVQRDVENEKRIEDLNNEIAALRKQNEEDARRVQDLEAKLAETSKTLAAAQQKLKTGQRQSERAAGAPSSREKALASRAPSAPVPSGAQPPSASPPRRTDEAGSYEVVRDTALLEKPSSSSREVALVQRGMIVNVVGSVGDWLEVRSKYGKPPGFIRRQDVTPKRQDENRDRF
jgi:hypothetical protein